VNKDHQKCGWQVRLCDPSLTRAVPERFRDEQLITKRYANKALPLLIIFMVNQEFRI